jgi:hypothetical protein
MNDVDIKLIGDKELLRAFRELDVKTQHKRLHQVLSHAGNIPKKAASQVIPTRRTKLKQSGRKWHPPGTGKKSIMKKRGRSKRNATLFVGPRTGTGSYKNDAYYLKVWDLYKPGKRKIARATEGALPKTEKEIFNSMRTIITRAFNRARK